MKIQDTMLELRRDFSFLTESEMSDGDVEAFSIICKNNELLKLVCFSELVYDDVASATEFKALLKEVQAVCMECSVALLDGRGNRDLKPVQAKLVNALQDLSDFILGAPMLRPSEA